MHSFESVKNTDFMIYSRRCVEKTKSISTNVTQKHVVIIPVLKIWPLVDMNMLDFEKNSGWLPCEIFDFMTKLE